MIIARGMAGWMRTRVRAGESRCKSISVTTAQKFPPGKDIIPVEIKAGARVTLSALRGLSSFIESYKGKVKKAYVVTTGRLPEKLTDTITAIPWQFL